MSSAICYTFRDEGDCKFGDSCRFSHGADDTRENIGGGGGGNAGPCYQFRDKGDCRFGDSCRFSHGQSTGGYEAGAGYGAGAGQGAGFRRKRGPRSGRQECWQFRENGVCQYEDQCRFAHGEEDERDLKAIQKAAAGPCYNWRDSKSCKFGNTCRFSHDSDEAAPAEGGEF